MEAGGELKLGENFLKETKYKGKVNLLTMMPRRLAGDTFPRTFS
jgi:hypothetical protein